MSNQRFNEREERKNKCKIENNDEEIMSYKNNERSFEKDKVKERKKKKCKRKEKSDVLSTNNAKNKIYFTSFIKTNAKNEKKFEN